MTTILRGVFPLLDGFFFLLCFSRSTITKTRRGKTCFTNFTTFWLAILAYSFLIPAFLLATVTVTITRGNPKCFFYSAFRV
ncbi:hypothetical protein F4819DRAFT_471464 [Hypoxylon fuscum]|nr:hypothetical protein F4819DRAFT_471464 [Hypoxylon fuscum]